MNFVVSELHISLNDQIILHIISPNVFYEVIADLMSKM